jgi:hypothetical protein
LDQLILGLKNVINENQGEIQFKNTQIEQLNRQIASEVELQRQLGEEINRKQAERAAEISASEEAFRKTNEQYEEDFRRTAQNKGLVNTEIRNVNEQMLSTQRDKELRELRDQFNRDLSVRDDEIGQLTLLYGQSQESVTGFQEQINALTSELDRLRIENSTLNVTLGNCELLMRQATDALNNFNNIKLKDRRFPEGEISDIITSIDQLKEEINRIKTTHFNSSSSSSSSSRSSSSGLGGVFRRNAGVVGKTATIANAMRPLGASTQPQGQPTSSSSSSSSGLGGVFRRNAGVVGKTATVANAMKPLGQPTSSSSSGSSDFFSDFGLGGLLGTSSNPGATSSSSSSSENLGGLGGPEGPGGLGGPGGPGGPGGLGGPEGPEGAAAISRSSSSENLEGPEGASAAISRASSNNSDDEWGPSGSSSLGGLFKSNAQKRELGMSSSGISGETYLTEINKMVRELALPDEYLMTKYDIKNLLSSQLFANDDYFNSLVKNSEKNLIIQDPERTKNDLLSYLDEIKEFTYETVMNRLNELASFLTIPGRIENTDKIKELFRDPTTQNNILQIVQRDKNNPLQSEDKVFLRSIMNPNSEANQGSGINNLLGDLQLSSADFLKKQKESQDEALKKVMSDARTGGKRRKTKKQKRKNKTKKIRRYRGGYTYSEKSTNSSRRNYKKSSKTSKTSKTSTNTNTNTNTNSNRSSKGNRRTRRSSQR